MKSESPKPLDDNLEPKPVPRMGCLHCLQLQAWQACQGMPCCVRTPNSEVVPHDQTDHLWLSCVLHAHI